MLECGNVEDGNCLYTWKMKGLVALALLRGAGNFQHPCTQGPRFRSPPTFNLEDRLAGQTARTEILICYGCSLRGCGGAVRIPIAVRLCECDYVTM